MTPNEAIYLIENLTGGWEGQYREARDMAIEALNRLGVKPVCTYCGAQKVYAKGLCRTCYERNRRYGSPAPRPPHPKKVPPEKPKGPEWPHNLYVHIFGHPRPVETPEPADYQESVRYVLSLLTEREREALVKRYRDGLSLRAIGECFGVSTERARQIIVKAERRLRHPSQSNYIIYGIAWVELRREVEKTRCIRERQERQERLAEAEKLAAEERRLQEWEWAHQPLNVPIEELDLMVRAFTCLFRNNLKTVGQIVDFLWSGKSLLDIRNLGEQTASHIHDRILSQTGVNIDEEAKLYPFSIGDTVYLIGRYGAGRHYQPNVIATTVVGAENGMFIAADMYGVKWRFTKGNFGKLAFTNEDDAAKELSRRASEELNRRSTESDQP